MNPSGMQTDENRALHQCACIKCGEAFMSYDGDAQYCGKCKALARRFTTEEAARAFLEHIESRSVLK